MRKLFTEGTRGEPKKQTEIGLIPESWDIVELGEIARIERGKFSHRPRNEPRFYGGDFPFVQTGDIAIATDAFVLTYKHSTRKAWQSARCSEKEPSSLQLPQTHRLYWNLAI